MSIDEISAVLLAGGLAIVPTDTVYGLAAALDSTAGVDALYALKGRPRSQPCQVLLYDDDLIAEALAGLDERTAAAARALLPGPVTCLVPDPSGRYRAAAGASPGSVGIRAPLMRPPVDIAFPLVATSANDPGGRDPAEVGEVPSAIRAGVPAVLDRGRLTPRPSTVVDLRDVAGGQRARIVRPGADAGSVRDRLERMGVAVTAGEG